MYGRGSSAIRGPPRDDSFPQLAEAAISQVIVGCCSKRNSRPATFTVYSDRLREKPAGQCPTRRSAALTGDGVCRVRLELVGWGASFRNRGRASANSGTSRVGIPRRGEWRPERDDSGPECLLARRDPRVYATGGQLARLEVDCCALRNARGIPVSETRAGSDHSIRFFAMRLFAFCRETFAREQWRQLGLLTPPSAVR